LVQERGGKPYWARYLFEFIHAKFIDDIEAVSPLPKAFRRGLFEAGYHIGQVERVETCVDADGTVKFLFAAGSTLRWETVLLTDEGRHTLCISTQAGCRMGCRFCATGRLSQARNLTAGQIVDQVYQATSYGGRIHNVVYMGMGEPLDNMEAVVSSLRILNDERGLHLGQRHLTVSTCGLPEGIDRLAAMDLQVRLAISLHASDDELRSRLMPINRRHDLAAVLGAARRYQEQTGRRVTFEYIMIKDVNDRIDQAQALVQRLQGIKAHVNLIEFNEYPGSHYAASDPLTLEGFAGVLRDAGLETVVRFRRGRSIKAACGQLGAAWLERLEDTAGA
jgi:23S rRNA (adenine2503-C2)-methyltransferase